MNVRDAVPEDLPVIVDFNTRLAEETEGKTLSRSVLERGVARALQSPDLCRYWVAELDGRVVGQAMVTFEMSDWRDGVLWWLQSVYVERTARSRGAFRALFTHIRREAETTGSARGLRLYVELANMRATAVYERLGMKRTTYGMYELDWSGE